MKLNNILLTFAILSSGLCFAQEPNPEAQETPKAEKQANTMPAGLRARLLREFDKDKDGYLNKEELDAAKKVLAERQAKFAEMQKRHSSRIIKQYDKDGDGKLDQEELIPLLENQMRMLFEARGRDRPHPRPGPRQGLGRGPADVPPPPPAAREGKVPPPPAAEAEGADKTPPPPPHKAGKRADKKPGAAARDGQGKHLRGEKGKPRPDRERMGAGRPEGPRPEMRRPTEADLEALAKPEAE